MDELLEKYIDKWNLSSPKFIVKTPTSHVYKVLHQNKISVLKIYTNLGRVHESIGPMFLEACVGNGVIEIYKHNNEACVLEYIDGVELISIVDNDKDEEATFIIAQTLNKIHSTPIPQKHNFKSLLEHMRCLFKYAEQDDVPSIIKRAALFAKAKLRNQQKIFMLHGDIHHKNIMYHSRKGWVALDPQSIIGERAYDCANTLHNPHKRPDLTENEGRLLRQATILGQEMNINPQQIIDYAYIHGALSSCWTKDDDGYYSEDALRTSALLESHISKDLKL